ncbi:MAG: DNA cytosine methyltransferase [Tagaea sp.]|nr:DNA cytosine methyltransferase [Tagaea sp.]
MKALDLFCGAAGGWHFGLARAGIEVVAGCEADPWRRAVYSQRYGVPVYPDIRTLTARQVFDDHGSIDVVCGSPPCQDASTANAKGQGVAGARTGLFFDALALIAGLRPTWVCLENVPGLRTRGYDRVHDGLESIGYDCRPIVVGARHAGAPHRRNRVVVVANLPRVGRGSRGAWGFGAGDPRQPQQAFHDADPATVCRSTVAGCQSDRDRAGALPDTHGHGEHGKPGHFDMAGALGRTFTDGHEAGRGRLGAPAGHGGEPQSGVASNAAGAGLALGQDERGDGGEEQPAAIGAMLARWSGWNGGPPALGGVDDGVSAALAARRGLGRACLAAYGDSFVPIFPELLGRFIRNVELDGVTAP